MIDFERPPARGLRLSLRVRLSESLSHCGSAGESGWPGGPPEVQRPPSARSRTGSHAGPVLPGPAPGGPAASRPHYPGSKSVSLSAASARFESDQAAEARSRSVTATQRNSDLEPGALWHHGPPTGLVTSTAGSRRPRHGVQASTAGSRPRLPGYDMGKQPACTESAVSYPPGSEKA